MIAEKISAEVNFVQIVFRGVETRYLSYVVADSEEQTPGYIGLAKVLRSLKEQQNYDENRYRMSFFPVLYQNRCCSSSPFRKTRLSGLREVLGWCNRPRKYPWRAYQRSCDLRARRVRGVRQIPGIFFSSLNWMITDRRVDSHLRFGQQRSESPERSSARRRSSYPFEFLLRLYLKMK